MAYCKGGHSPTAACVTVDAVCTEREMERERESAHDECANAGEQRECSAAQLRIAEGQGIQRCGNGEATESTKLGSVETKERRWRARSASIVECD